MADGRRRDEWSRWSQWFALFANMHRDPKKSSGYRPSDFDPYHEAPERKKLSADESLSLFSQAVGAKKEASSHGG